MDYPGKVITKNQVTPSQTSASGVWTVDDAAAAVENNSWPVAGVPNPISRSLRFNSADSAYLNRTPATAGNRKTWTWSGWVKRCNSATSNTLFGAYVDANNFNLILLREDGDDGTLTFFNFSSTFDFQIRTSQVFRDPSAWYHIVVAYDSTQATSSNRVKIYINGVSSSFSTANYPTLNFDGDINNTNAHYLGQDGENSRLHNGYMTEVHFVDGQALTPASFGMTDPVTGAWIPKAYNGTYGTNGFYLNFSNNASTTALGLDYSGNSNTWTTNNFSVTAGAGNDSLTDVPTPWIAYNTTGDVGGVVRGNYATLNPLDKGSNITLTNGNLQVSSSSSPNNNCRGTFGMSSGKWYFEFVITSSGGTPGVGIGSDTASLTTNFSGALYLYLGGGDKVVNGAESGYGASYTTNDVIGIAFDADSNSITFYKNNISQGAITGITSGLTWRPFVHAATSTIAMNFGQRPFAYTPPAGFLSLCTTNLPTPTILDGGEYFNTVLYTGNASTNAITGVGFQPDWVWIKSRSNTYFHRVFDAVRGATKALYTNDTLAEETKTGELTSFDSDGFSLGGDTGANGSGATFVAWNWKAGGTPAVTNTAGTITSSISVNTTSGFSIVTYTGNATAGATVGHGLGVAPAMIIVKARNSDVRPWTVYHSYNTSEPETEYLRLNTTNGTADFDMWNDTAPTSTVFSLSDYDWTNDNASPFIAYCFAAVPGFSAFGSYTGNGSADGPFVYTGVRARYILVKRTNDVGSWRVWDTARNTYNLTNLNLVPNDSQAEASSGNEIDILSNGFKLRSTSGDTNASGATYIYMAFAENPFKYSNAR